MTSNPEREEIVLTPPDADHPVTPEQVRDAVQLAVFRLFNRYTAGSEREEPISDDPVTHAPRTATVADLVVYDLGSLRVKVTDAGRGVLEVTASAKPVG